MRANLIRLLRALHIELERMEWEDLIELDRCEVDLSFDLGTGDHPCSTIDDDLPDEIDDGPVGPLCVECGNYGRSCVC